jgi:hypothetical protein
MRDALDKIRVKGGPKVYKRGPTPRGRDRLAQRALKLLLDAHRFAARTADADHAQYAAALARTLRSFVP